LKPYSTMIESLASFSFIQYEFIAINPVWY
jgi:hypothetical protein